MAVMTLAAHLAAGLNLFALSPLLPLAIEEYEISHWAAGMLVSLPMLIAAAIGLPGSILIARVGVKRAYMLAWLAMALLALAPIVPNLYVLLFLRLAYGVGLALMVVADWAAGDAMVQAQRNADCQLAQYRHLECRCCGLFGRCGSSGRFAGLENDTHGVFKHRNHRNCTMAVGAQRYTEHGRPFKGYFDSRGLEGLARKGCGASGRSRRGNIYSIHGTDYMASYFLQRRAWHFSFGSRNYYKYLAVCRHIRGAVGRCSSSAL